MVCEAFGFRPVPPVRACFSTSALDKMDTLVSGSSTSLPLKAVFPFTRISPRFKALRARVRVEYPTSDISASMSSTGCLTVKCSMARKYASTDRTQSAGQSRL